MEARDKLTSASPALEKHYSAIIANYKAADDIAAGREPTPKLVEVEAA